MSTPASNPGRYLEALRIRLHYVNRAWTVKDYRSLLEFFVRILPRLLEAERCSVFIRDQHTGRIVSTAGTGLGADPIEAPVQDSVVGRAITTGRCLVENDLGARAGFHRAADAATGFNTRSLVCAPVRSVAGHAITGAVEVLNKRAETGFSREDAALAQEAADYLSLALENIVVNQEIRELSRELGRDVSQARDDARAPTAFVGESDAMQEVLELVRLVSETPVSVVIQGENGTGKEVIARMIHEGGERARGPFVAVNCAAIPDTLVESEFFGYERGAFTGAAASRPGRFEEARGGTLFLDEVADLPLSVQPKLLRAIQEQEGSRLGANKVIPYDVRLISATNKDLRSLVAAGSFREDLFYRLFAVEIHVPPLRERPQDIAPLAWSFFDDLCRCYDKALPGIANDLLAAFERYPWPGNVRQLQREVERLVALTPPGHHLTAGRCSPEIVKTSTDPTVASSHGLRLADRVRELERDLISQALDRVGGNKAHAAALLGITRQGLHKKLKRLGATA